LPILSLEHVCPSDQTHHLPWAKCKCPRKLEGGPSLCPTSLKENLKETFAIPIACFGRKETRNKMGLAVKILSLTVILPFNANSIDVAKFGGLFVLVKPF
jgi:hypothetical protein